MSRGKPFVTGSVVGVGLGRFLFAAGALTALCAPALAGPEGQKVVSGSAKFARNGSTTTITASNNSIINYSSFNIGRGETVRFIQPGATARVLNRVSGGATTINGALQANGIVYILNPAGVFFGGHAVVNTAGLVAGAGTMTNRDFLGGIDRFTGLTGSVENFGVIQSSNVALIGQYVANHGVIYTDKGTVTMAAGDEVYMGPRQGGLFVKVKSDGLKTDQPGVENSGTIVGGASLLTAGDMYSMAVRNTGTVHAKSIKVEGQGSGVVSVSGTLDASARGAGETGGRVEVTGEKVGLFGAIVRADGPGGGGDIRIGGEYQGGAGLRAADAAYVSPGSTVTADATEGGDGGEVIVWSRNSTRTYGTISARGAGEGSGGLVETSGKVYLDVGGTPDVRAESGRGGRWLIDPENVTIVAGGGNTNINTTSPFAPIGDDAQLGVDLIETALLGAGVTVEVNTGAVGAQAGDITLATTLDFNGIGTGDTLLLTAANDIIINGAISDSAAGGDNLNLQLVANNDAAGGGSVTINQAINLAGGTFSSSGVNFTDAASDISASLFTFNHTGNVTLNNGSAVALGASTIGGDLTVTTTAGNITDTGTVTVGGNLVATNTGVSDDITLDQLAVTGTVAANTAGPTGDVTVTNATALDLAAMTVGGNLSATATTGNVTDSGTVTVGGNAGFTASQANDDIFVDQLAVTGTIGVSTSGATADATIVNATGINFSASGVGRNLSATATTGNITDAAGVTTGGNATFTTSNSNDDINLDLLAATGAISLNTTGATGNATVVNASAINFQTSNVGGNLVATAATGNMTDAATVTVGGNSTFGTSASGATITLDTLAAAGVIIANTLGAAGNASITNATGVILGASSVGGNMTVVATTGNITDSGTVTVGGNASYTTAQANDDIFVDQQAITGTVALSTNGAAADATITNASGIDFAASGIGRNLVATASTGNITDGAAVTVGGNGSFTTSGANADITLDAAAVTGSISVNTSGATGNASVTHATGVDLGASTVGGGLTVVATTGNITDSGTVTVGGNADFTTSQANDDITVNQLAVSGTIGVHTNGATADATIVNAGSTSLAASQVGRNLDVTAGAGNLVDSGTVTVGGNAAFTITAGGGDVTVNQLAVTGTIAANTTGATGDTTIVNATGVNLQTMNVGGNLAVTATTGNITDAGTVTVGGTSGFTTSQANDDIVVDQLTATGAVSVNTNGASADATVVNSIGLDLGASSVGRNLVATATTGNVTDSGTVTVGGTADFTASQANDDIVVNQLAATGVVTVSTNGATADATVVNASALALGASTVGRNLVATATTGNLTDAAAVTVGGNGTFTTSASGADITLDATAVTGAVGLNTAGATGDASFTHATGVNLNTSNVGGALTVVATTGNITDSGTVTVGGNSSFTTSQANDDIVVNQLAATGAVSLNTSGASGDATVVNAGALNLGASTIGRNLAATSSTGNVTDSGTVTAGGTGAFTAADPGDTITLDTLAITGPIALSTNGAFAHATIVNATAVDLAASSVGGNLSVTATTGTITDSGPVVAGGTGTFTASAANQSITLDQLTVSGQMAVTTSGSGNVTIVNGAGVTLQASSIGGDLTVTTTTGGIFDDGTVTVGGNASFTALNANEQMNIDQLAVAGTIAVNSNGTGNADVTLRNATGIVFAASTVGDNLTATATTGNITDGAAVTVGADASYTTSATGADITLDQTAVTGTIAANTTGAGGDVSIIHATGVTLAASSIGGGLTVVATTGNITDSGTVTVGGNASFTASQAGDDITVNQLAVTGAVSVTTSGAGGDATVVDAAALNLGASTVGGDLSATATTGNVSDSGIVTVGDDATFTAAASGADVSLDQVAASGSISLNTSGAGGDATLIHATAVDLAASSVGGTLSVIATSGDITDSGVVTSGNGANFTTAGAGSDITLNQLAATGPVTLSTTGPGGNATVVNASTLDLGASSVDGDLSATATTGDITDSGNIDVTGNAAFTAAGDITLDNQLTVGGTTTFAAGDDITLVSATAVDLLSVTAGGDLTVTAGGNITDSGPVTVGGNADFTTTQAGDDVALDQLAVTGTVGVHTTGAGADATLVNTIALNLAASEVGGDLSATATTGNLTDAGAIDVDGAADFTTAAAGADITLNQLAVTGAITPSVNGAGADVTIVNATGVAIGAWNVPGNLAVTATTGNLTDTATATVGGTGSFTTSAANATITLDQLAVTGPIDVHTTGASGNAVLQNATGIDFAASGVGGDLTATASTGNITDSGTLTIGDDSSFTTSQANADIQLDQIAAAGEIAVDTNGATGNATIDNTGAVALAASTVGGALSVTSTAGITQSGALDVDGTTTLAAAPASDITLTNAANDFTGAVAVTSGQDVALRDASALVLGASSIGGDLAVTTVGALTQTGALAVTGDTTLTAGAASDITLGNAANDFSGAVSVVSANDVTLVDADDLALGNVTATGDLTATAANDLDATGGDLTITGDTTLEATAGDLSVGDLATGGLNATAGGSITQAAATTITATGATTLAAGTGATDVITLAEATNDFAAAVAITSGGLVTLRDANNLTAGGTTASDLVLTAGGTVGLTASTVGRDLTIDAGGSVTAAASTVTRDLTVDTGAAFTHTGALTVGRNVDLTAATTIGQSAGVALTVTGTTALDAGGNITLNNAANNFVGAVTVTDGAAVVLGDANALHFADVSADALAATAATDIIQDAGSDITLTGGASLTATAGAIALRNLTAGTLTAAAGTTINQGGGSAISVTGATNLTAGTDITLNQAANDFVGAVDITSGGDASLRDANDLALAASSVGGDATLVAGGAISQTGALAVGGDTSLEAGGNILLSNTANNFTGLVTVVDGAAVNLRDASALTVGDVDAGSLTATAATTLSQATGTEIDVTGAVSLTSTAGAMSLRDISGASLTATAGAALTQQQNTTVDVTGGITMTAAGNVAINDLRAGTVAAVTSTGGSIEQTVADAGATDITANSAVLQAASGIGNAGAIDTQVGALTATNSTTNAINIAEVDGITLTSVDNDGGAVVVSSGGAMAATSVAASTSVTLDAAAGDLTVGSVVAGTFADIQSAAGSITEIGVGDAGNDVVAPAATLTAAGTVGGGAGGALETAASTLTATGPGGINLRNTGNTAATFTSTNGAVGIVNIGTLSTNGTAWTGDTFDIRAGNLQINDAITSDGGVAIGRASSGTIGLGTAAGNMQISGAELANISGTSLTIGGSGTTAITVGDITGAQTQGISGLVTLSGSDPAATIAYTGDSVFNTLASISAGATSFADDASVTTDVGSLSVTAGGGIATAGDASLSAAATLTLANNLSGGGAGTTLALAGTDVGLNALVDVGAGNVSITRTSAGAVSVGDAAGGLRIDGDELSRITAAQLLLGGAQVTGITVNGVTAAHSDTIGQVALNAAGAGATVAFTGNDSTFRALSATGAGGILLGTDLTGTTGAVALNAATTLTSDATLTGAGLAVQSVNSDGTPRSLTLNSTGNTGTTLGSVGQTASLAALITNADGTTTLGGDVTTTQTLALNDDVLISTDVTASNAGGSGVTFGRSVTGPNDLTVDAAGGAANFGGDVDLSGAANGDGGSFGVTAQDTITIGGDVSTAGGASTGAGRAAGDVTLVSGTGSVEVGAIDASGSDAASGAGGAGGDVTITPSSALEVREVEGVDEDFLSPVGVIILHGDINAGGGDGSTDGSRGDISLASGARVLPAGDDRPAVPATATIVAYTRDGEGALQPIDVTLTGDVITVGPNEKISSLGAFTANASQRLRVGDVAAAGDIRLVSPLVEIYTRPGADLLFPLSPERTLLGTDEGVDLVSGASIQILRPDGTPHNTLTTIATTSADAPITIAAVDLNNSTVFSGILQQQFNPTDAEQADLVFDVDAAPGEEIFLDLNSQGSSIQNVASSLAGVLPTEARPEVSQNTGLDASQRDKIRQLGITPRDLTTDELIEFLVGVSLYDDYPTARDASRPEDFTVAVNRLPSERVTRLLAAYEDLFYTSSVDPETGETVRTSRTTEIQESLTQAVRRYRQQPGVSGIDPVAFRAYLETTPDEGEALQWVHRLEDFLKQLKQLGLGPKEERIAIDELLKPVLPRGINTAAELEQVILPPPPAEEPATP